MRVLNARLPDDMRSCGEQDSGQFMSCRRSLYLFVVAMQINVGRKCFKKLIEITVVYQFSKGKKHRRVTEYIDFFNFVMLSRTVTSDLFPSTLCRSFSTLCSPVECRISAALRLPAPAKARFLLTPVLVLLVSQSLVPPSCAPDTQVALSLRF